MSEYSDENLKNWNDRADWIQFGIGKGWISPPFCNTHEGDYEWQDDYEREEWDEGHDPCSVHIKVFEVD